MKTFLALIVLFIQGQTFAADKLCRELANARGVEICQGMNRNMVWSMAAHGMLFSAPHRDIGNRTIAKTYCSLAIRPEDEPALVEMVDHFSDLRMV